MGMFTTIKPTSTIQSTYLGLPDDMDDYVCSDWQIYHSRNKQALGLQKANEIFLIDVGRIGNFASMWVCKYDCDFIEYLNKNGMPYNSLLTNMYCATENISEAVQTISEKTNTVAKISLPLILGGLGLAFIYKDEIKKALK